jgi:hypothetical protein
MGDTAHVCYHPVAQTRKLSQSDGDGMTLVLVGSSQPVLVVGGQ